MKQFLLVPALLLFPACAQMQQQYVDRVCNYDGAFQEGYNDGQFEQKMDNSFVQMCAEDQEKLRAAYREGYDKGATHRQPKALDDSVVKEAPAPQQGPAYGCVDAYGEHVCGYDCRYAFGVVKCAKRPEHNCVAAYGVIKCGQRCRSHMSEIICERYE